MVQEIASALDAIELRRLGVRFPKELGRRLRWDDDRWADKYGLQEFFDTFRFRWSDFRDVLEELDLARMNVHDGVQFRIFAVGRPGDTSNFPADVCMMALLALLATPSTVHQVASYMGIPSNSVDECNHFTGEFLQENFAERLNKPDIWLNDYPTFSSLMRRLGAPYRNMTGVIDGNFVAISRPMGLGNSVSHYDQKDV